MKKRVMILASCHSIGGFETKLDSLVHFLDRDKFEITLMLIYPYYKAKKVPVDVQREHKKFLSWDNVDTIEVTMKSRYDITMIFRAAKWIKKREIDILYYFSLGSGTFIGPLAGIASRVPVIIREVQTILDGLYPRLLKGLDRLLMNRVNLTLTPSHYLKDLLINELGIDPTKIRVIPNAINLEKFTANSGKSGIRAELGLNGNAKIVGMIANLLPVKAHSVLLDAVPDILESCPETHFIFIGEGPLRSELLVKGRDLGILSNLHFLGYRNDVEKVIPAFHVGVLCSWVETYGIALTEMMAAGVPVVATNVGGIPEVVDHGENGFLVEAGNSGELARVIASLLQDGPLSARLGRQAREKALNVFSKDHMISATESVLMNAKGQ